MAVLVVGIVADDEVVVNPLRDSGGGTAIRFSRKSPLATLLSLGGCCRTPYKKIKQKPQLSQAEAFLCPQNFVILWYSN